MLRDILRMMRPHHWVKNAFVALPAFLTLGSTTVPELSAVLQGIVAFCLASSAIYLVNDIADRRADALHPIKCRRPLAAGRLTVTTCALLVALLLPAAVLLALPLAGGFQAALAGYLALNLGYSFGLKRIAILDVMCIALGFVLRVLAGTALIASTPTVWIILITWLLALFLALAKRRDDIVRELDVTHRRSLSGYNKPFLDSALSVTLGAMVVSYMICMTDAGVMARLGSQHLYLSVIFVTGGALRYLQITFVEEASGSPTEVLLRDRFLQGMVGGWLLLMAGLLYVWHA